MPSLIGSTVAANYQRNVVYFPNSSVTNATPFTNFGTRELSFLKVTKTGYFTTASFGDANSNAAKIIRGVQLNAELYGLQRIDDDKLLIVVAKDTLSDWDSATDSTAGYGLFETAINLAAGTSGVAVAAVTFS
jgi:hypothetical protein